MASPRHRPAPGYGTGPPPAAAVEAALALQARCVCKHSLLVHGPQGCALCEPPARRCAGYRERRGYRLRAALAALRARP